MRLNQVTLNVADIDRAVDFYLRLGLRQIVADTDYARFICPHGNSTFSILKSDTPVTPGAVVYFECENLDVTVDALKQRGVAFDGDPVDQKWLWREAHLSDPDGNRLCLYFAGDNRLSPPWVLDPPRRV